MTVRRALALTMLAVAASSGTALAGGHRAVAFSGGCQLSGAVSFAPLLTNTPQAVTQPARAAGTCDGTFVDAAGRRHRLSGAPVIYAAVSEAPADSCLAGTASGRGTLTFPYGTLRFRMSETRAAAFPLITLTGARSGSAVAAVTPSPEQDPVGTLRACAGAGLATFSFDGRLQTTWRIAG